MKSILLFSTALLFHAFAFAQSQGVIYAEDSTLPVKNGRLQYKLAWAGGTSNPEPNMADLNHDGLLDLVIFEYTTSQVKTFINIGSAGLPKYQYQPKYAANFPGLNGSYIGSYLIMVDYNRDGVMDIFEGYGSGLNAYRGFYNSNNELEFVYFKEIRYSPPGYINLNMTIPYNTKPGVADIDGDGDLDIIAMNQLGSFMTFFKNCQVEQNLPKDSIQICVPSKCWGFVQQVQDKPWLLNIDSNCDKSSLYGCRTTAHGSNNLCLLDIDGDGDIDVLNGNDNYKDIQFLKNGKVEFNKSYDTMISQQVQWQTNGDTLFLPNYPAASFVDIDADGKRDILLYPHDASVAENVNNLIYYKNTGTASAPAFTFQTKSHIVNEMLDFGSSSKPALYDYNKDGRLDMIVGSDGYFNGNGGFKSRLSYFQNVMDVTTTGKPTLFLLDDDFAGLSSQNFAGAAPAVGDLDNDGKDDLVVGHTDGSLSFYKNMATSNNVKPDWRLNQIILKDDTGGNVEVGYYAAPFIYDLDGDGFKDLIIGCQDGTIYYYKNHGLSGQVSMKHITNKLGNMQVKSSYAYRAFSSPFIGKIDDTNQDYILVGNVSGQFTKYTGFRTISPTGNYTLVDTFYSYIKQGSRTAAAIGDLTGDGTLEMVVGNVHGGLHHYKQINKVGITTINQQSITTALYPNPAANSITLSWKKALSFPLVVSIYDATGRKVFYSKIPKNTNDHNINLPQVGAGVYQCIIEGSGLREFKKFVILQP